MCKWSAECEELRENLKAATVRNAEKEQSIEVLKQELVDFKAKAAKKGEAIKNMEKGNDQLKSELEQLEHFNKYLADECRKRDSLIDRQKITLRNEKTRIKATEKCVSEIWNKKIMIRPATL